MADQSQPDRWAAGRLTSAQLDALLQDLAGLAVPLPVAGAALAALAQAPPRGPDALPGELLEIIRCDPALTERVLSLAASGGVAAIPVAAAARQLGAEAIRLEVLAACATADDRPEEDLLSLRQLHRHSLAVALAAEALAPRRGIDPGQAFVCGLLHDLGKLALTAVLPKSFRRAAELAVAEQGDISDLERRLIGIDHATVGRRLAEMRHLPPVVVDVIWLHHQPAGAVPPAAADAPLIELVGLADTVARQLQLGFSGNFVFHPSLGDRAAAAGITEADVQSLLRKLPQTVDQHEQEISLAGAGLRSVRQLAAELVTAHRHLHTEVAAATAQAAAFHQLGAFAAAMGEQSSVPVALERIAELLAGVCGLLPSAEQAIVVYSIDEASRTVEVVRRDGRPRAACRTLPAAASLPPTPPGEIGAAVSGLLANPQDLADWLDPSTCRHVPLVCTGRWVGGVVLPANAVAAAEASLPTVASAAAMALAIVQSRCRAVLLSEQLAGASRVAAASQQAMVESKAMSAIGELAAGAAHELNNPLAVISGRAQIMHDKAASAEERRTWALITEQAQRISDTLTDLMEIATPPPPSPERVELVELLRSAAEAFSSSGHPQASSAQVDIEVGEGAPAAWADVAQIRWVITEAITNAATAAEGQAHVRLTGRCGDDGQSVLLTVSDDGPGMDAATMERAFTPFFSLQRAGRRQGLGLPKARRYVENNAGKIWIASQPGKGTQLHVQLPRA